MPRLRFAREALLANRFTFRYEKTDCLAIRDGKHEVSRTETMDQQQSEREEAMDVVQGNHAEQQVDLTTSSQQPIREDVLEFIEACRDDDRVTVEEYLAFDDDDDTDNDNSNSGYSTNNTNTNTTPHRLLPFIAAFQFDPNATDENGLAGIHHAASEGSADALEALLDDARVLADAQVAGDGFTPLHYACHNGHSLAARKLINDNRVNVNRRNNQGLTPLMIGASEGYAEVVGHLLETPSVDARLTDPVLGWTAFMRACARDRLDVVIAMLRFADRMDFNAKAPGGKNETGFLLACREGAVKVIEYLVTTPSVGNLVDINAVDGDGNNAFGVACLAGALDSIRCLGWHEDRVKLNHLNRRGLSGFAEAALNGRVQAVDLLLNYDAVVQIDMFDAGGATPFFRACERNDEPMIRCFLKHQSSFNLNTPQVDTGKYPRDVCSPGLRALIDSEVLLHRTNHRRLWVPPTEIQVFRDQANLLGHGGGGNVYRGVFRGVNVAVKEIRGLDEEAVRLGNMDGEAMRKFEKEVNTWAMLATHRNSESRERSEASGAKCEFGTNCLGLVLNPALPAISFMQPAFKQTSLRSLIVLEIYCWTTTPCQMVCPIAAFGDLHTFLDLYKNQPDYPYTSLSLLYDLALGMHHVHQKHVVHGDLKTANVLVDRSIDRASGRHSFCLKIGDFGMSRIRLEVSAPTLDQVGMAGTVPFMAPELLVQGAMRKRPAVDVYAFAMIAYEVASQGREPFVGEEARDVS